jgi:hypothetical protein
MTLAQRIYEAAKPLPEPLAREVLDFIEYLRAKGEREGWSLAQQSSLEAVWNNEADEVWNDAAGR